MPETHQPLIDALRGVLFPGFDRDIVTLGLVESVDADERAVRVALRFAPGTGDAAQPIEEAIRAALAPLLEGRSLAVHVDDGQRGSPSLQMAGSAPAGGVAAGGAVDPGLIPDVQHVVAVASGKGGVGKSTVATNLACALAASGLRVGLLDADIYGPSIPLLFGRAGARPELRDGRLVPFERDGVRFMSLGFLVPDDKAVIWRGPMVMKALEQLLRDVHWGALDILLVDMPPGTGDAQLTMSQRVQLAGAVIVTTPQDLALADAVKGVTMFQKVDVPILGVVENMSHFHCPACGHREDIFGHGGGRKRAEDLGIPFLGEIPLHSRIRVSGDRGRPVVLAEPESAEGQAFREVAERVAAALQTDPQDAEAPAGSLFDRFRRSFGGPRP